MERRVDREKALLVKKAHQALDMSGGEYTKEDLIAQVLFDHGVIITSSEIDDILFALARKERLWAKEAEAAGDIESAAALALPMRFDWSVGEHGSWRVDSEPGERQTQRRTLEELATDINKNYSTMFHPQVRSDRRVKLRNSVAKKESALDLLLSAYNQGAAPMTLDVVVEGAGRSRHLHLMDVEDSAKLAA